MSKRKHTWGCKHRIRMHTRALHTQRHTSYAVHVCVSPMYMSSFPHSLYQETRTYIHTCMRTCRYVCRHAAMHACVHAIHHHTHIMCVHVCMYVCMYIHTYIHHTYILTCTFTSARSQLLSHGIPYCTRC